MAWLAGNREADRRRPARSGPPAGAGDGIRASDAERELVLEELGNGFAQGRLSHETFVFRVEATLRARRRRELDDQLADLPPPPGRPVLERALALGRTAVAAVGSWGQPVRPPRPPALVLPGGPRHRYTIGRESACDVSISDQTVSRWHADLRRDPGGWRLADLGSTNGTRLNGGRVTAPVLVRPGDLVSFGTATFVLARGTP